MVDDPQRVVHGLVLTGSLDVLPELWLRLRESVHRWVVGVIYGLGLAVHVIIGTSVLASGLLGAKLPDTFTAQCLGEHWIAVTWVGLSIFGFDLVMLGLVLAVGFLVAASWVSPQARRVSRAPRRVWRGSLGLRCKRPS